MKIINFLKVFPVLRLSACSSIYSGEYPYFADLVLFKLNGALFISSFGLIRLPLHFSIRLLVNKSYFNSRTFYSAAKAFPPLKCVLYISTLNFLRYSMFLCLNS